MLISPHSDLHEEIVRLRRLFEDLYTDKPSTPFSQIQVSADVLVFSGDIDRICLVHNFLIHAAEQNPNADVIFVPGNHEFYGEDDMHESLELLKSRLAGHSRIHVLSRGAVVIGDTRFLGATLWTDFSGEKSEEKRKELINGAHIQKLMDYQKIKYQGEKFSPANSISEGEKDIAWLQQELDKPFDGKTVVVTHFCPIKSGRNKRFPLSPISHYFCLDLGWLIKEFSPSVWIYGHTHYNFDKVVGMTRLVSNQKGYPTEGVRKYNPDLLIEI